MADKDTQALHQLITASVLDDRLITSVTLYLPDNGCGPPHSHVGTTVLVPSHLCLVTATCLEIGCQQMKFPWVDLLCHWCYSLMWCRLLNIVLDSFVKSSRRFHFFRMAIMPKIITPFRYIKNEIVFHLTAHSKIITVIAVVITNGCIVIVGPHCDFSLHELPPHGHLIWSMIWWGLQ